MRAGLRERETRAGLREKERDESRSEREREREREREIANKMLITSKVHFNFKSAFEIRVVRVLNGNGWTLLCHRSYVICSEIALNKLFYLLKNRKLYTIALIALI
jgi:hypothetical protein